MVPLGSSAVAQISSPYISLAGCSKRARRTVSEIIAEHPDLTSDDVREALLYAAEAVRERELPLRHTA